MTYRNRALLDLARGQPCMVRIPGICNGDAETTVAAHSGMLIHGAGTGHKAADCFIAFACSACHDAMDGRRPDLDPAERRAWWTVGYDRTVEWLWSQGLVEVAGKSGKRAAKRKPAANAVPKTLPRRPI